MFKAKLSKPKLITLLSCTVVLSFFFQALTWGSAYRFFAYATLLLCISVFHQSSADNQFERKTLLKCLLPMFVLIVLEWAATYQFPWEVKAIRHVLLASGLLAAIVMMARDHARVKSFVIPALLCTVYAYTLFQWVFIYVLGQMYGTTKNPHYLAIYSALFLVVATFIAANWSQGVHRYGMIASAAALGFLLLNTSSRPTWIALMIATLIGVVCLRSREKLLFSVAAGLVFFGLFLSNTGNFKTRLDDLIMHANTEERVTIWEDTWTMQQQSSQYEWLFGHGVESFKNNFQPYSRYYANEGITYNSPHNAVLELLYQFGIVGLVAILSFILWLYYALFTRYYFLREQNKHDTQMVILLLLTLLTITLVAVSITLPFFVSIHLNVIALVMGVMFYLDKRV